MNGTLTSLSPLFAQLLTRRGLIEPEQIEAFLSPELSRLEDPFQMKGVQAACERIQKAAAEREKILVHGDYDVDGITGAALMAKTLQRLSADFSVFLPNRKEDGYGVSEEAIRKAHQNGVSLLMTVDCGITAAREIRAARSLGLDVIVLDHHRLPADGLPPATVILNPLQEDCPYPFKELSAAGLAFKLSQALLGERAFQFLDLAALSTVCDVAPLVGENRVIVKNGLERLSRRENIGLRALAEAAGLRARELNVGHVGFMLGPRINAAGRMSSPEIALRLLITESVKEAESLAEVLEEENKMRQREERQVLKEALNEVERSVNFNRDRVIVVGRRGWHQGVIGIVASRLVDKYHRPAVVIAFPATQKAGPRLPSGGQASSSARESADPSSGGGGAEGIGKGSGRSIKGFHLFEALEACKHLFEEFGGHEQAAGLSIKEENLAAFRQKVNEYAKEKYPAETFVKKVPVDLEIGLQDLKSHFVEELKLLEPHGAGNPRPVFLTRGLLVKSFPQRLGPQTVKFWLTDGSLTAEATWSDRSESHNLALLERGSKIDLAYSVKTKLWDGMESLVLEVKDVNPQL